MPLGKRLAICGMTLILLLSAAYLVLSRYTAYDSEGHHYFDLPWRGTAEDGGGEDAPNVSLVRGDPTDPLEEMHAVELSVDALRRRAEEGDWWTEEGYNAVILRLKEPDGLLRFASETAEAELVAENALTRGELQTLKDSGVYIAAHLSCFRDSAAALQDMTGKGLCQRSGYVWYDAENGHWLDPGKTAAQDYLLALCAELADWGFDELVLENVGYPTAGRLNKSAPVEADHEARVTDFLLSATELLQARKLRLSLALEEETLLSGGDEDAGLRLAAVMDGVRRVYVPTEGDAAETALDELSSSAVLIRVNAEEGASCQRIP